jgi:hypothetical protein
MIHGQQNIKFGNAVQHRLRFSVNIRSIAETFTLYLDCHFMGLEGVQRGYAEELVYDGSRRCVVFCYQLLNRKLCGVACWHDAEASPEYAALLCVFS